ncbi:TspO/MBR-related protein [Calocera cornea HHB12733]|uniref:TspO/MBR-related protein n=1 Tax=Calocera cornea HHB12733 TaxID=1353952 RepID=A0A165JS37_9BASI|nr:TspO/MBR-related protein [Calocera cornea HHB12733]
MPYQLPPLLVDLPRNPVLAVGIPLALGSLSGFSTYRVVSSAWYEGLKTPPGRPPRQVFPIVWPVLYAAMGYASHLAVHAIATSLSPTAKADAEEGLALYWGQLALNVAWTPIFFGLKNRLVGLVDLTALTGAAYYMTYKLHGPTNGQTTYFLAPYCAWLTFALYLNGGVWYLNRNYELKGKGKADL